MCCFAACGPKERGGQNEVIEDLTWSAEPDLMEHDEQREEINIREEI